jgi:C_GCAxxG_C_C family probable redox protein
MGFHCSQSVLEAYAEDFGLDPLMARRLAAGLAGGSTTGGECGALASGFVVLGLKHGRTLPSHGDPEKDSELFDRLRKLVELFRARHGGITCPELMGVDVLTPEGREEAIRKGLFQKKCLVQVRDVVEIIDSLG